jgi:6-phosphogluconolactonase
VFKKICDDVILKNGKINIALSGGNTPKLMFEVLARDYKNKIDWLEVNLFWVDERCVPPNDKESNFGMTEKILLRNISIPEENVHRIFGNYEPEKEVYRYSQDLKKYLKLRNGFPEFDLILLGVGDDGHTASIFPNQMALLNSNDVCAVAIHPSTGQKRITLTGEAINNADRIYFLVMGKNKEEVIKKILEKKDDYLKYPAANIKPDEGEVEWYLDKEAAGLLIS